MTEAEWLNSTTLKTLTDYLLWEQKASLRKIRLLVVACCRRVQHLLPDEASRKALAALERFTDGHLKPATLSAYVRIAVGSYQQAWHAGNRAAEYAVHSILIAAQDQQYPNCLRSTQSVVQALAYAGGHAEGTSAELQPGLEHLKEPITILRELVRNPFLPVPARDPGWLEANSGVVARLANSIYDERRFAELPILADALEDAGCTDAALLDHCRNPGLHTRGCWALDVVLGKE